MCSGAQAAEEMLKESGLEELEERVLGFLCTNSGSLKLLSTLDDAQRLLQQVPADGLLSLTACLSRTAVLTIHPAICSPVQQSPALQLSMGPKWERGKEIAQRGSDRGVSVCRCTMWQQPAMLRCSRTCRRCRRRRPSCRVSSRMCWSTLTASSRKQMRWRLKWLMR